MYHAFEKTGFVEFGGPTNYMTLPKLSAAVGMPAVWSLTVENGLGGDYDNHISTKLLYHFKQNQ